MNPINSNQSNIDFFRRIILITLGLLLISLAPEKGFGQSEESEGSTPVMIDASTVRFLQFEDSTGGERIFYTELATDARSGSRQFQQVVSNSLEQITNANEKPSYIFIASDQNHLEKLLDEKNLEGEPASGQNRVQEQTHLHLVSVKTKESSAMSIGVAVVKSVIGIFYYFHYLPVEPALAGSVFSTFHNLIFTAFPLAEQKLLLNPFKSLFGIQVDDLSTRSRSIDLVGTTLHKLVNLGIVTTIINWQDLNLLELGKDIVVTSVMYTLIKGFWKIHFDYQLKARKISEKVYFYTVPSLELVAYGLMPAIMLEKPWAIAIGVTMGLTGAVQHFLKQTDNKALAALRCAELILN